MAPKTFKIPLHIRYGETDQMGVVHHASFLAYLEDARTRFMEALGHSYAELERAGIGLPVRSLSISYRSSARFGEDLNALVWVEKLSRASVTFAYEIRCSTDDRLVVEAEIELACTKISRTALKVTPLPEALKTALSSQ
ncbi:MAG: thioesterase family protein [Planctomycetota bacterium]|nr:thioesterase family protein [Planctomycetota bacterium]